jgi:putative heme iron utilization protein
MDQARHVAVDPTNDTETARRVREAFNRNRRKMTPMIAEELGVSECDVIRHLPDELSVELDLEQWEQIILSFESLGDLHVITNNGTVTLEAFGKFGNFSKWGPYFNVQTKSLDMHIRHERIGAVFAVVKPSHMDGHETLSFQFFDIRGQAAFKVFLSFGSRAPSAERRSEFEAIRDRFRTSSARSTSGSMARCSGCWLSLSHMSTYTFGRRPKRRFHESAIR